jgi:hypothetical protein
MVFIGTTAEIFRIDFSYRPGMPGKISIIPAMDLDCQPAIPGYTIF